MTVMTKAMRRIMKNPRMMTIVIMMTAAVTEMIAVMRKMVKRGMEMKAKMLMTKTMEIPPIFQGFPILLVVLKYSKLLSPQLILPFK